MLGTSTSMIHMVNRFLNVHSSSGLSSCDNFKSNSFAALQTMGPSHLKDCGAQ